MPSNDVIMPDFYYSRLASSDRDWIRKRMAVIPEDMQQDVANEYEKLYLGEESFGRNKANTYLNGLATEYRDQLRAKQNG